MRIVWNTLTYGESSKGGRGEYVTGEHGKRTKVILDIEEYERLVEAAEDEEDIRDHKHIIAALRNGETELIPSKRRTNRG